MVPTTCDAEAERILMPMRPASVPSATVIATILSRNSWSIRTSAALGPPTGSHGPRPAGTPQAPTPHARWTYPGTPNSAAIFCAMRGDFLVVSAHNLVLDTSREGSAHARGRKTAASVQAGHDRSVGYGGAGSRRLAS